MNRMTDRLGRVSYRQWSCNFFFFFFLHQWLILFWFLHFWVPRTSTFHLLGFVCFRTVSSLSIKGMVVIWHTVSGLSWTYPKLLPSSGFQPFGRHGLPISTWVDREEMDHLLSYHPTVKGLGLTVYMHEKELFHLISFFVYVTLLLIFV